MTITLNNKLLDKVILNGEIIKGKLDSVSKNGHPVIKVNKGGIDYLVDLVESNHEIMGEQSNNARKKLLNLLEKDKKEKSSFLMVKIIKTPGHYKKNYEGVYFVGKNKGDFMDRMDFNSVAAHSVVVSDYVFYALCTQKTESKETENNSWGKLSCRVKSYYPSGELISGFLKPTSWKRPSWEYNKISEGLINTELQISKEIINGSKRFGFPGINQGDKLLVRVIGDNKHMKRSTITSFFEPIITIREFDKSIDMYQGKEILTKITDWCRKYKTKDYGKGDIICNLPIITAIETENFGKVGVGYIPKTKKELKESKDNNHLFYLKKVWVQGGEDYVGSLAKKSEIIFNKGMMLAKLK